MNRPGSLNRVYSLVWSVRLGAWVVASELTKRNGKTGSVVRSGRWGTAALLLGGAIQALAQSPSGGTVVGGTASIVQSTPTLTTITQATQKAIIDWQSFSIGAGNTVQFIQPNASAIALNRVTGNQASQINGSLLANGQVWLLNPNGVLIGAGGQVNVGSFLGTTHSITNQQFMQGDYRFSGNGVLAGSSISNLGSITANNGGYAILAGNAVRNEGTIQANLGQVVLGGAKHYTVDVVGDKLLSFAVTGEVDAQPLDGKALVDNVGTLQADGGRVTMTAKAVGDVIDKVVNTTGLVQATTAQMVNGEIVLDGGSVGQVQANGTLNVSNPTGQAGKIAISGETVKVSGNVEANGKQGGRVDVTGSMVDILSGRVNASGTTTGGLVRVGGAFQGGKTSDPSKLYHEKFVQRWGEMNRLANAKKTTVDQNSSIDVSSSQGSGGTVVVWSDQQTIQQGRIVASGAASAGAVEISSAQQLLKTNLSNVVLGAGGFLLLDPKNITISNATSTPGANSLFLDNATAPADFSVTDLQNSANNGTSVVLQANNDITISNDITVTGNGNITLQAGRNINFNANITLSNSVLSATAGDPGANPAYTEPGTPTITIANGVTLNLGNGTANFTANVITGLGNISGSGATVNFNNSGASIYSGSISGSNTQLTKTGAGTFILSGDNTYTGKTTISTGVLSLLSPGVTGDVYNRSTSSQFDIAAGATLNFDVGSGAVHDYLANSINMLFTGSGTISKTGSGVVRWGVGSAEFRLNAGALIDVQAGTFIGGSANNENWTLNQASLNVASGAIFKGIEANIMVDALTGSGSVSSGYSGYNSNLIVGVAGTVAGTYNTAGTATFSGVISDTDANNLGKLTKIGSGTQILSGSNTYTGATNLNNGTLSLGSAGAIGGTTSGTVNTGGGTINFAGGTLQYSSANALDYSSRFSTAAGQIYTIDTNGQSVSYAGALSSSSGSLTKQGLGTLTLTGSNTFNGGITLAAGTLSLGSANAIGSAALSSGVIKFTGGTLQYGTGADSTKDYSARFSNDPNQQYNVDVDSKSVTFNSALSSAGGTLTVKSSSGLLNLTANHTFSGTTTILDGSSLVLGFNTASGNLSGDVIVNANAVLKFQRSDDFTFASNISGSGTVVQNSSRTTTLSGNNTHSGATVASMGVIRLGHASALSTGGATVGNNATLDLNGFTPTNANLTTIRGTGYNGQGALTNTSATAVSYSGAIQLSNNATIAANAGAITLNSSTNVIGNFTLTLAGSSTGNVLSSAINTGSGGLVKDGSGKWSLSGNSTFTGATILNAGTLTLLSSGAISGTTSATINTGATITFNGGTLQHTGNNLNDYSSRFSSAANQQYKIDTNGQSITFASALTSSTGSLTKSGTGTLTLTGANTFTGTTTITEGTLQIGNGGTTGSINATNSIVNNGSLVFNRSNEITHSGAISGTGSITKLGNATLNLTGNNTYSGGTLVQAGNLQGQPGTQTTPNFGTGDITIESNAALWVDRATVANNIILNGGSIISSGGFGNIFNGSITVNNPSFINTYDYSDFNGNISGAASLTLSTVMSGGSNKLVKFIGNNSNYSGALSISNVTLQIGNGGTTGSLAGTNSITNNSALVFNLSNNITFAGAISGTGSVTQQGTGITSLTGTNTYSGITILKAGVLALDSAGALGGTNSGAVNTGGGTISFEGGTLQHQTNNGFDYSARFSNAAGQQYKVNTLTHQIKWLSALTSPGGSLTVTTTSNGFLSLNANNTYDGGTTITSGSALNIGYGGFGTLLGSIINNGVRLSFHSTGAVFSGNISGSGVIEKWGAGALSLTGNNTYTGGTVVFAGTLEVGSANAISGVGNITLHGGRLRYSADNNTDYSARFTNTKSIDIDTNGRDVVFANNIGVSGASTIVKSGLGTLTLAGNVTLTGATNINEGTLQIGNGGATGDIGGTSSIVNNGALVFNRSNDMSFGKVISGSGTVTQAGLSALTLTAVNTYTGNTTISSGTLQIGSGGTSGSITSNVFNSGTLIFNRSDDLTYSKVIYGTGDLTKNGTGTLTLTGGNNYTGATNINSGTLQVGNGGTTGLLGVNGTNYTAVNIAQGATLSFYYGGTTTVIGINPHTISGDGTLKFKGTGVVDESKYYIGNINASGLTSTAQIEIGAGAGLQVAQASNLGSANINVLSGGSLLLSSVTIDNPISISGLGITTNMPTTMQTGAIALSRSTINGTVTLNADSRIGTFDFGGTGPIYSQVNGEISGSFALEKSGDADLILAGNNTYIGGTTIQAGTVKAGSSTPFGTNATSDIYVFNGATLDFNGQNLSTAKTINISGAGNSGAGVLTNSSASSVTYAGQLNSASSTIIANNGSITFSGNVTGGPLTLGGTATGNAIEGAISSASLTKIGSGTWTLKGNNTYTGATTISAGTLEVTGALASNSIANEGNLTLNPIADTSINATISGSGSVSKNGIFKATLTGNNTFNSGFVLNDGTLELLGNNTINSGVVLMGGTLALGSTGALGGTTINGVNTQGGFIRFAGGTMQHSAGNAVDYSSRFDSVDYQQFKIDTNGRNVNLASDISSVNGSLYKLGIGTLTLSGTLGYADTTTIQAGILKIQNDSPSLNRQFEGTGSLVVESASASFASAITLNSSSQFANTLGALAIGGNTNTADINITDPINIAGNVILAGGNINVGQSVSSSNGFVMLRSSAKMDIATGTSIQATNNNIVLTAARFVNNNSTGASALSVGAGKTWQVYSTNANPFDATTGDVRGNLVYDFKQYNYTNGSAVAGSGNGFLYSYAPILIASLVGSVSKVYDGTTSAVINQSNHSLTGLVDGDNVQINVTGTAIYASAGTGATAKDAGTNKLIQIGGLSVGTGNNNGASVFGYALQNSTASGVVGSIEQAVLSYKADPIKRTVGQANPALTGSVIGFVASETLATATQGTLQFASLANAQSAAGSYAITGQGLTAANYRFEQATTNATALTVEAPTVVPPIYIPPPTPLPLPTTNTTSTTTTVAPAPSTNTSTTTTTSTSTTTSSSSTTSTTSTSSTSATEATSTASTTNTSSTSTATESTSGSTSASSATPTTASDQPAGSTTTEAKPSSSAGEPTQESKKEEPIQEKKADNPPEKKPEQKAEAKSDTSSNTGNTAKTTAPIEPAKSENTPKAAADAPAANQTPATNKPPATNTPAPAPVMALAPSPVPTSKPPTPKDAVDTGDKTLAAVAPPEPTKPPSSPKRTTVAVTPVAGSTMVQQQVTAPPRAQLTPGVETRFSGTPNSGNW